MGNLIRWTAIFGMAVSVMLVGGVPANAQPAADRTGNVNTIARSHTGRAVTDAAAAAEVEAFWTPERMASAVDLDLKAPDGGFKPSRRVATGPAGSVAPVLPAIAAQDNSVNLNESKAVGKVYVNTPNGTSVCSASTLGSGKRRLVITAGHCVHAGAGGGWYSNFIFVPRLRSGIEPFGRFVASSLTTRSAWAYNSSYDEDMAIAVMHNGGWWGQKVVDVVGGNGMRWNWGYDVPVTILGYPAAGGYPGDVQYYCQGTTWYGHGQEVRAWCGMTGGSSGGPWLQEYNESNGLGYVNSVVSHRHLDPNQMDGPYFDDDIKSLYDFAEGLSPA